MAVDDFFKSDFSLGFIEMDDLGVLRVKLIRFMFWVTTINLTDKSSSRICLIALRFQLFIAFTERKKEGTIQYGYRKWGTHARVFSQTLAWEQQE